MCIPIFVILFICFKSYRIMQINFIEFGSAVLNVVCPDLYPDFEILFQWYNDALNCLWM